MPPDMTTRSARAGRRSTSAWARSPWRRRRARGDDVARAVGGRHHATTGSAPVGAAELGQHRRSRRRRRAPGRAARGRSRGRRRAWRRRGRRCPRPFTLTPLSRPGSRSAGRPDERMVVDEQDLHRFSPGDRAPDCARDRVARKGHQRPRPNHGGSPKLLQRVRALTTEVGQGRPFQFIEQRRLVAGAPCRRTRRTGCAAPAVVARKEVQVALLHFAPSRRARR